MKIEAPWPGTVQEILVAVGDTVEVEQAVLTLESMKMMSPVPSPGAGTVAAIHVAVGDFVEQGVPLLTIG